MTKLSQNLPMEEDAPRRLPKVTYLTRAVVAGVHRVPLHQGCMSVESKVADSWERGQEIDDAASSNATVLCILQRHTVFGRNEAS